MTKFSFFLLMLISFIPAEILHDSLNNASEQNANIDSLYSDTNSIKKSSFNPVLATLFSTIIPGTGQLYTKHPIKGGAFLAAELSFLGSAWYWKDVAESRDIVLDRLQDSIEALRALGFREEFITEFDSLDPFDNMRAKNWQSLHKLIAERDIYNFEKKEDLYRGYNALAWGIGIHVFNVYDAYESALVKKHEGTRNPKVAGWLSAIPGLGLGQIYNGAYSKAGMILMAQSALAVTVLNNNHLMKLAEDKALRYNDSSSVEFRFESAYRSNWESKRNQNFRSRNTFLWYSIFFYFYGIFDAIVDAHLYDYPQKIDVKPDLIPQKDGISLNLKVDF